MVLQGVNMVKEIKRLLCVLTTLLLVMSIMPSTTITARAAGTVDDFVERCYTVTLDRSSDPDGFADWKGQLLNGKAVGVHVAYGFLFSEEYTNKNKSNEDYVTDLYMLFMGREPDPDGFNDWVSQLKSGKTKLDVFIGFANSQEFYNICDGYGITAGRYVKGYDRNQINDVNLFVERLYKTTLGRRGDIGGQKDWVVLLLTKQITGVECARRFIQSTEYTNLGLSDEEYVENLYLAMMGRPSDESGKANWLLGLSKGMTRDEVFAGFANSVEFAQICNSYKIDKGSYSARNKGNYDPTRDPENPSYSKYKVGEIIKLGKYEQDGNQANGKEDIEWEVLSTEGDRALVISKYALDCVKYNEVYEDVTWETCSLRKWLNSDFYNIAFDENEQKTILSTNLDNKDGWNEGNNTIDDVFCLSFSEIGKYYKQLEMNEYIGESYAISQKMICKPTIYAKNKGAYAHIITEYEYSVNVLALKGRGYSHDVVGMEGTYWWTRTPGHSQSWVCVVDETGWLSTDFLYYVNDTNIAVRPAMYIRNK